MNLTLERRTRGKRGRDSYGKTPAFGILQRNAKVYTEIAPDCSRATLQTIIRGIKQIVLFTPISGEDIMGLYMLGILSTIE